MAHSGRAVAYDLEAMSPRPPSRAPLVIIIDDSDNSDGPDKKARVVISIESDEGEDNDDSETDIRGKGTIERNGGNSNLPDNLAISERKKSMGATDKSTKGPWRETGRQTFSEQVESTSISSSSSASVCSTPERLASPSTEQQLGNFSPQGSNGLNASVIDIRSKEGSPMSEDSTMKPAEDEDTTKGFNGNTVSHSSSKHSGAGTPVPHQSTMTSTGDSAHPTLSGTCPSAFDSDNEVFGDIEDNNIEESLYYADSRMGGQLELSTGKPLPSRQDVDFVKKMNESYHESKKQLLTYQRTLKQRASASQRPPYTSVMDIATPSDLTYEEFELLIKFVKRSTQALRPVDWDALTADLFQFTGYVRSPEACRHAFERAFGQYSRRSKRVVPDRISTKNRGSISRLLRLRDIGRAQRTVVQDMIQLNMLRTLSHVSTFNFSSGSVVDMVLKMDGPKMMLATASAATQDIYNRPGNLLLTDITNGTTKQLNGHEVAGPSTQGAAMASTVNDIKLSTSGKFFISGSNDQSVMIWDAESGRQVNRVCDHTSKVNRIAVLEEPKDNEDVFASCSADGTIQIYKLNQEGQIVTRNKPLMVPSRPRCISSLSFSYGYFWDCLAAGLEAPDDMTGSDSLGGMVIFYDANVLTKVSAGELGFRQGASGGTGRSVSCLSFSPSGEYLVCGTSGRSIEDDEKGDGVVRVFETRRGREIQSAVSGHEDVNLVDFSPCERYIYSGDHSNEIAIFDRRFLNGARPVHRFYHPCKDHTSASLGITSALWWRQRTVTSQDMLMTSGGDGMVRLWDIRRAPEDAELWSMDAKLGPIARMIMSPDSRQLIIGGDTGAVSLFSLDQDIVAQYADKPMRLLQDNEEEPMEVDEL
ncbi:hypothetical protein BGW38_010847 [Lunasporangiospora selenospora]|uniref:Uncharacterized protein n=1 Tax=Lunasporangiospora selenospora TaxID=979761 RepID=A0A9P6KI80_9FUNG|nr:hypothetical protein BGW38_010847 [Lunasporangiospora selenospora]